MPDQAAAKHVTPDEFSAGVTELRAEMVAATPRAGVARGTPNPLTTARTMRT